MHAPDSELMERSPVPERHIGINERTFNERVQRGLLRLRQLGHQPGNHRVPARKDAVSCSHAMDFSTSLARRISDLDASRRVARSDDDIVEADADRFVPAIEPRIIHLRTDDILGVAAGDRAGNQRAAGASQCRRPYSASSRSDARRQIVRSAFVSEVWPGPALLRSIARRRSGRFAAC